MIKYIFQSFLQFFEFEFKEGSYQGSLSSDGKITGEGKLVEKDICIYQGSFVDGVKIAPYSLVSGNPMKIKNGYYKKIHDST